jgi:hypothetical protein
MKFASGLIEVPISDNFADEPGAVRRFSSLSSISSTASMRQR